MVFNEREQGRGQGGQAGDAGRQGQAGKQGQAGQGGSAGYESEQTKHGQSSNNAGKTAQGNHQKNK